MTPILFLIFISCGLGWAASLPGQSWQAVPPEFVGMSADELAQARDYALTGDGSGMIVRSNQLAFSWGDPHKLYDLKSTTKSFGAAALGIAIKDGKIRLEDKARQHHPTLGEPSPNNIPREWLEEITVLHLASQTAGFEKPGGSARLLFRPGTHWDYSDSGPNWLAECLTLLYRRDLNELMFDRVFSPIGIKPSDLTWRRNQYRPALIEGIARREFGAGIHANVNAMARFGLLHLRSGRWKENQILSREYVNLIQRPLPNAAKLPVHTNSLKAEMGAYAPRHYGLLWWNNADGTMAAVPRDAFWSWGLYESVILVIPSLDLVVTRAGMSWKREKGGGHYDVLQPFFEPVVRACKVGATASAAPAVAPTHSQNPATAKIRWASTNEITRLAPGSDNWPMTWGDDDRLYTAYGDGRGFVPFVPEKLSLGLARISGSPPGIAPENLRSDIEGKGDGRRGLKASGILMVDGILYLWLRNATSSQLAWSDDHGRAWKRADWKWTRGFGCPTFLNFGPNYAGARDDYVYIYSPDSDEAYAIVDHMILARVPKTKIREADAYEYFRASAPDGSARWTANIAQRGTVLTNPGRCYRSGLTYNAGLRRYLWCVTSPVEDRKTAGGLLIYDAPEPWGRWDLLFATDQWDTAPGESASFPTKWMSPDGRTAWLVFSGNDHFSLRKATFICRQ